MKIPPKRKAGPMRRGALWFAALLCLLAAFGGCAAGSAKRPAGGRIVVWADGGILQSRLQPLADRFAARDGVRVEFRFAPTARLEQEAEKGVSADLLIFSGEAPMKALYKAKTVDNYNLFAFREDSGRIYSIAKPMTCRNYWYAQRFADLVAAETSSVSGSNPNL